MLSEEQFYKYYQEKGRLPGDVGKRKNPLNDKQLHRKWVQYQQRELNRQEKKKQNDKDERWENIRNDIGKECLLIKRLREYGMEEELEELDRNGSFLIKTVDGAHFLSRSKYPSLIYYPDNVIPLNRYSHSMLDTYRDPISGEQISKEEHDSWWEFLLGEEKYNRVLYISSKLPTLRKNGIHAVTEETDLSCIGLN